MMKFEPGQLLQLEYRVSAIEEFPGDFNQGKCIGDLNKDDFVIFLGGIHNSFNDMYIQVLSRFGKIWMYARSTNRCD